MNWIDKSLNIIGLARKDKQKHKTQAALDSVLETLKKRNINTSSKILRSDRGIADWRKYIDQALSQPYYNRYQLYELYEQSLYDAHLSAQVNTRKSGTLHKSYTLVNQNGAEDKKTSELIQKDWFQEVINCILDSVYYGFTAIEVDSQFKDGEIQKVGRVHSKFFSPERQALLPQPQNYSVTIPLQEPLTNWLLTFGKSHDIGLLAKASRYTLYKNFSVSDWARHSERFGTPFIVAKTAMTEESELQKYGQMLGNFGNNGWAILDEQDDINLLQQTSNKPYEIYLEMIKFCDEQISKIIVGQTGTADQKSFVGAAEVQERILNWYVEADMKLVRNEINNKVLPFLIEKGYPLEGLSFEWQYFLEKTKPQRPAKSKELNLLNPFEDFQEGCC